MIGKNGPSDSARAAARGGRLRRPAAARHAARCASRALCSGGAPRRYPPSGVSALTAPRLENLAVPTHLQKRIEQELFSTATDQARTKLTQHRMVKPRIGQLQIQRVLP